MLEDKVLYAIPSPKEDLDNKRIARVKQMFDESKMVERSNMIDGCKILYLEGKFIALLDDAYKSYLLGMNYTTVSLCAMASERLCYDLIENSEVKFNGIILDSVIKESFYKIPLTELIEFCSKLKLIEEKVASDMKALTVLRNQYVHPTFSKKIKNPVEYKIQPEKDAKEALNILIGIVNGIQYNNNDASYSIKKIK